MELGSFPNLDYSWDWVVRHPPKFFWIEQSRRRDKRRYSIAFRFPLTLLERLPTPLWLRIRFAFGRSFLPLPLLLGLAALVGFRVLLLEF